MRAGGKDALAVAGERAAEILDEHWPEHIPAQIDERVRSMFGITVKPRPA